MQLKKRLQEVLLFYIKVEQIDHYISIFQFCQFLKLSPLNLCPDFRIVLDIWDDLTRAEMH